MRKFINKAVSFFLLLLLVVGCQNKGAEEKGGDSQATPFEFAFDVGDIVPLTKAGELDDLCPGLGELEILANNNHLLASLTIVDKNAVETVYENIELNFVKIGDGKLVTDPILMNIPQSGQYCFNVLQVTIYNNEAGDMKPIFSSMHESSENQAWVDEECLLPSPDICLDQDDLYQKHEVNVCVFCAYDEDAEFFGYIKWNIQFKRFICLPFAVNICDVVTNEDIVGTGIIQIQSGTKVGGEFVPDGRIYDDLVFPAAPNKLADICFIDEMDVPNSDEWYNLVMVIGDRTFEATVSVAELLTYNDNTAETGYDSENHYIHFWFCDGKTHWFFEETTPVATCYEDIAIVMPENNSLIATELVYFNTALNSWEYGLPGDIDDQSTFVLLPAGSQFATRNSYMFRDNGINTTTITLFVSATGADNYLDLVLYDGESQEQVSTYTVGPIESTQDQYVVYFDRFNGLNSNRCYFVRVETNSDIQFKGLTIEQNQFIPDN